MFKNIPSSLLFVTGLLFFTISSCKKKSSDSVAPFITHKAIYLNQDTPSVQDTLYVKRDQVTANLRVNANTFSIGMKMKRLYIFTRPIDNVLAPGAYKSVEIDGFKKDSNNNFYSLLNSDNQDSTTTAVTVGLRANDLTAIAEEFYFIYTDDNDYAGPGSGGVVIGPAQFFILYGKLSESTGKRIYNYASTVAYHYPGFDVVNLAYKYNEEAAADMDIYENTDNNPLFTGKFTSQNGTSFVKAESNFPYANATDTEVAYYYSLGTSFTETPDSINIGDIYLMKLRGTTSYAAMKIMYIVPENGKTGGSNDNEYFIFNLKK
ncbi:hypothetical protein [Cytophaga hutchinsonii]|uniref:Uncharacterized protein n=1 Tax=Cytophaga hutchinsonii (strain ATCC 33406 / DSM 1761 / CIP 103989 / NBRC 15051 / NCIMB 9469 / D465) TaxID=269798 RepID=A0A6N4SWE3_CYTH3|nr:hypothetical protein [Cytophaga hutchinsonii]ABG60619.1 hypothetical protein CHU_3383 [Cytophaga hutchinsonii ATCC 33406]SFX88904.1 hypothetical protein SAMN04487930_11210 [Cytophaga hutchinsonii ATCC 33406]